MSVAVLEASKTCTKCREAKPVTGFHRKGDGRRRSVCKTCRSATRLGIRRETSEQRLRRKLRDEYRLTLAQFDALLNAQGGACAICRRLPEAGKRLAVDHCHSTGVVRALLCTRCNLMVGVYETHHRAAAEYLAAYGAGNPLLSP